MVQNLRPILDEILFMGQDLWSYREEGFFQFIKSGRKNWGHMEIRREDFHGSRGTWRDAHEVAHMILCKDQNVMNPWWDHNRFIDTEGPLRGQEVLDEAQVLRVHQFFAMDRQTPGHQPTSRETTEAHSQICSIFFGRLDTKQAAEDCNPGEVLYVLETLEDRLTDRDWLYREAFRKYNLIRAHMATGV